MGLLPVLRAKKSIGLLLCAKINEGRIILKRNSKADVTCLFFERPAAAFVGVEQILVSRQVPDASFSEIAFKRGRTPRSGRSFM
jgi:hypothetical protein